MINPFDHVIMEWKYRFKYVTLIKYYVISI